MHGATTRILPRSLPVAARLPQSRTTGILIARWAPDSDFSSGMREGKSRSLGGLAARATMQLIERLVANLLDNAIVHNTPRGSLEIAWLNTLSLGHRGLRSGRFLRGKGDRRRDAQRCGARRSLRLRR